MTYKDSLHLILENAILVMLFSLKLLAGRLQWILPKHWALVGQATTNFKVHIGKIIQEGKYLLDEGNASTGNFISAMVRASENAENEQFDLAHGANRRSNFGLRESEIYGNIFVFNFAGHDSIAITLTYVITHLAAHLEVQDWIAEEIKYVCKDHEDGLVLSYHEAFYRLKRCTAVVVREQFLLFSCI